MTTEELHNTSNAKYQIDKENSAQMLALNLVSKTNASFFLTGRAGTGKTTFLHYIQEHVKKNFVIVAPTGVAAIVVGGMTIHSFFGMPFTPITSDTKFNLNANKWSILKHVHTIIVDEISMVRCDIIDGIDRVLQKAMENNLPFGGKQIIFSGDLYQLEPVLEHDDLELVEFYHREYNCDVPYFYHAHVFKRIQLPRIEFSKVYRQNDPEFQKMLENIRHGRLEAAEVNRINKIGLANYAVKQHEHLILTSTNKAADTINQERIDAIDQPAFEYEGTISGEFNKSSFPSPSLLTLKVGTRVMFTQNDTTKKWVNGTVGTVTSLTEDSIMVELDHGDIVPVQRAKWENIRYTYHKDTRKLEHEIIGTYIQFPLKLAWAITIHKSQGMTFDDMTIDLSNGVFMPGQLYVALSRVCSLQGLNLTSPIRLHYIMSKPNIDKFLGEYNDVEVIEKDIADYAEYYNALQINDYDKAVAECDHLMMHELQQRKNIRLLPIDSRKKAERQNEKHEENAYFAAERLVTVMHTIDSLSTSDTPIKLFPGDGEHDQLLKAVIALKNKDYCTMSNYADRLIFRDTFSANYHYLKCLSLFLIKDYPGMCNALNSWRDNVETLDARYYYLSALAAYNTNQPFVGKMATAIESCPRYYSYIQQLKQMMQERELVLDSEETEGEALVNQFNIPQTDIITACKNATAKQYQSFINSIMNFEE
ncbi:MAG: DEAD/DEAH box helicase [Paludibacteraceae bacterium]|nr:DEAD/DEAH box helicase [Paludibacteraceae bacterium]